MCSILLPSCKQSCVPSSTASMLSEPAFPQEPSPAHPRFAPCKALPSSNAARAQAYSGAVLYADYANNLDSCITIRTMELAGDELSVQAGAGIVADSVPATEWEETDQQVARAAPCRGPG